MVELGEDHGHDALMGGMEALLPSSAQILSSTKRPAEGSAAAKPNKQAKNAGKGRSANRDKPTSERTEMPERTNLMACLLISLEDTVNMFMQEMEFMMFIQVNGPGSLGETAVKISAEWHQQMQNKDPTGTPLRMIMCTMFFKEMGMRLLKTLAKSEEGNEIRKEFVAQGLMSQDGQGWNYIHEVGNGPGGTRSRQRGAFVSDRSQSSRGTGAGASSATQHDPPILCPHSACEEGYQWKFDGQMQCSAMELDSGHAIAQSSRTSPGAKEAQPQ